MSEIPCFTITNPNCNYVKAYKRGTCSNDMCHTRIYLHDGEHIVDSRGHARERGLRVRIPNSAQNGGKWVKMGDK